MSKWSIAETIFFLVVSVIGIMFLADWRRSGAIIIFVLAIINLALKLSLARRATK